MPYIQIQHERPAFASPNCYVEILASGAKRYIAKGISTNDDAKLLKNV